MSRAPAPAPRQELPRDPLWYKDAIVYELHVRAFADSDGDGIGDFPGLIGKLDYLRDLGVTALWLLPFYPSPLRDDGYDIADYTAVHPSYGDLKDVRTFIREAHRRGLRVITELVANHTSDQHPWFQRARAAKRGSAARSFYVWSDTPDRYGEARVIFKDFESSNWAWDDVARQHYWHRFYSHQPDLNYDSPEVRKAILRVVDFWLDLGVDGLRIDAIPYLYEREGTNGENLPETHAFLKELRSHVDAGYPDRMLLGEANQWPEDAAAYFGEGDECNMAFHFPLMPRLFMGIRMEDRFPIVDILQQTPPIPESSQWALFLRNHDELTLEMVTDEERDYMYRVYTQDPEARINLGIRRRLAPLLGNNRRRIELMDALLFSLPGTPVIYYGDEIGMGDNIYLGDRNGVRTPMQWSADRNAGFSRANRQRLHLPVIVDPEYHHETVNVEAQESNPGSLLWWTRRLIGLRKRYRAFGRGRLELLHPENRKVLAFVREHEGERLLVVANLSRFAQPVELDLAAFRGCIPVEVFGGTDFPPIGDLPYLLTLGPHAFYWFSIESPRAEAIAAPPLREPPSIAEGDLFQGRSGAALAEAMRSFLRERRWFGGKARSIRQARVRAIAKLPTAGGPAQLAHVEVSYRDGEPETYAVPLMRARDDVEIADRHPHSVVARVEGDAAGIVFDALASPAFSAALLGLIGRRGRLAAPGGVVAGVPTPAFKRLRGASDVRLDPVLAEVEQSNNSVLFGERLILKFFRRLEPGINPDLEVGRFLTGRGFPHVPPVAGSVELRPERGEPTILAVLQGYVPNQGDAWRQTLDGLTAWLAEGSSSVPQDQIERAALLGRRTAELHIALASSADPAFVPEPYSGLDRRSMYQSARSLALRSLDQLSKAEARLDGSARSEAREVLDRREEIQGLLARVVAGPLSGKRTRIHGDLHLGQALWSGSDFVFIDFEGEPRRSIAERRMKRSPLRDAAGVLRSFDYAFWAALERAPAGSETRARAWRDTVAEAYLDAYIEAMAPSGLLPASPSEVKMVLDALLLEKALYELDYEMNSRPPWVRIPLRGILDLLASQR